MGSFSSQSAPIVAIVVLLIESQEMFSRIVSSSGSRLARQCTRPARGFARFANQSSRSYSTGASSGRHDFPNANTLASPFQIGFAVAAGLGCGAALLYGNRLFAVEVDAFRDVLFARIRNP